MSELAEGARLEIVYAPKAYLGFESPSLRQNIPGHGNVAFFKLNIHAARNPVATPQAEGWQSG